MKIGIIAPIWLSIPPLKYGGTEGVISLLTEGLVHAGHEVTFFGPKTAEVSAKIIPTIEKPLIEAGIGWNDQAAVNCHLQHLLNAFQHANEFDVLHMHLNKVHDNPALLLALHCPTPVLFTFHYPVPTSTYRTEKYRFLSSFPHFPYTTISNAARMGNSWNFIRTVYNAIDMKQFTFSSASDDYFVWIGKVLPIKGLREAIEVAKKAQVKLKIMAAVDKDDPQSVAYFKEVEPMIDGKQIEYLGEADMHMKIHVLGKAKAFLNPIQWPEPFGLVMAESLAVGTPVIALRKGAVDELLIDGKTGFIVESLDEMVEKIKQIDMIDRKACREHAEMQFAPGKMVEGYAVAYTQAVAHWKEYRQKQYALTPV